MSHSGYQTGMDDGNVNVDSIPAWYGTLDEWLIVPNRVVSLINAIRAHAE